jgi:hypothetical protein
MKQFHIEYIIYAPKIIIEFNNDTIILEPTEPSKVSSYYIFIYNLKYINSLHPEKNIVSEIPFYLSDGGTNKFRCNSLLPFICFNENDISKNKDISGISGTCPIVTENRKYTQIGLLFKYKSCRHVNLKKKYRYIWY